MRLPRGQSDALANRTCRGAGEGRTPIDRGKSSAGVFQRLEVAPGVAVVPELLLEHGVQTLPNRVRAVLEHVDRDGRSRPRSPTRGSRGTERRGRRAPPCTSANDGVRARSSPGHGKSTEPEFGNPIGSNGSPRIGTVNHLSMANTRWRSVCTNDHSSFTDSCERRFGERPSPERSWSPTRPRAPTTPRACRPVSTGREHRPQRVPRIALVDVGGDVDAVDHHPVDQRVDVDADEPGVGDRHVGEVDVAEAGTAGDRRPRTPLPRDLPRTPRA